VLIQLNEPLRKHSHNSSAIFIAITCRSYN